MTRAFVAVAIVGILLETPHLFAAESTQAVGQGSYAFAPPAGGKSPQGEIFRTENARGPMPTNDWWSSVAWMKLSERQYPHPLAVQAEKSGLRVYYPGSGITANKDAIFGFMPADNGDDLILEHSAQPSFEDARVDGFSDWFVNVRLGTPEKHLRVSYGHGSPFVFAQFAHGSAQIRCAEKPTIWSGDASSPVLGITLRGKHYGLFAPRGSKWEGLESKLLINHTKLPYFSLAILPDNQPETLALFRQHAYAHVTDTQVAWSFDPQRSLVTTKFQFTTKAWEGDELATLFALYPHQWRNTEHKLLPHAYPSVRGKMKLAQGTAFNISLPFTGVLPCLPKVEGADERLAKNLRSDLDAQSPPIKDTYWDGKWLGKLATLAAIAEAHGMQAEVQRLDQQIRERLETWFTAINRDDSAKNNGYFVYNRDWGTLVGYPASYGSDVELNDHHFHYGYFIKAAAEVARRNPQWAKDDQWGGMVKLLIRDIASTDRQDPLFPFLRNFDPYAGHTWASGHARFGDGNNNESSSEAMNAWTGVIQWGEATGDTKLRDLGVYLYATEMAAIQEYWFDIHDENHHGNYTPSVVTMIWGGKGANGTWFSANPEAVHGINWLPVQGGSLYLGHDPLYVKKNYQALLTENQGAKWDQWGDIVAMYLALYDPAEALQQFDEQIAAKSPEEGNSRANTYHWIAALGQLGQIDASITANTIQYAVFRQGRRRTYVVFEPSTSTRKVTFSDGFVLEARPGFTVKSRATQ